MSTILLVHNYYQQPGGEDCVVAAEADLLEGYGHRVIRYTVHNDQVDAMGSLQLAKATLWNESSSRKLRVLIREKKPSIVHFHNTFPLISPAAYYAAQAEGAPVVQTLHNYRLFCLNGCFYRDGRVCEDCFGKSLTWPGVSHACYRNSYLASGGVAAMLTLHRSLRTWRDQVDAFIACSEFALKKFAEGGLPERKLFYKPHFLYPNPIPGEGEGGYALFVGRLSPEKGVDTLLQAWERLRKTVPLKVVGDGPLAPLVVEAATRASSIEFLGRRSAEEVRGLMMHAQMQVVPSRCYETFGRVGMEALAVGTPVVAARIGAIAELVEHERTGVHFNPSDPDDLAEKVAWMHEHPEALVRMRGNARVDFERKYTAERNYEMLMRIYERAAQGRTVRAVA